ncbi:hypothetical protein ACWDUN_29885 [Mycobacterium sp. NPDC003323]
MSTATTLTAPDDFPRDSKTSVLLRLIKGGKPTRTLGYHPMTDDWRITPWDCTDPGRLTVAEARNVMESHGKCGSDCLISRTARKVLASRIDAPTVRAKAFRIR